MLSDLGMKVDEIAWEVELALKPGALDRFRDLTREMVSAARAEPGTLSFERHVSPDETTVYVLERYADSRSAVLHLKAFSTRFSTRFGELVERKRFVVFGSLDDELRDILDAFGALYARWLDGYDDTDR